MIQQFKTDQHIVTYFISRIQETSQFPDKQHTHTRTPGMQTTCLWKCVFYNLQSGDLCE